MNREIVARLQLETQDPPDQFATEDRLYIATESSDGASASTFNFDIPGDYVRPGMAYSVALFEPPGCNPPVVGNTSGARFPVAEQQLASLDVSADPGAYRVVVVPMRYNADGSGRLPDTSDLQMRRFRDLMYSMYPVASVEITVAEETLDWNQSITANGGGWSAALDGLLQHRAEQAPPSNVYYYGLFRPTADYSSYCSRGCVLGLGAVPGPNAVSRRGAIGVGFSAGNSPWVFAHEMGHTLGRWHAPCRVQQSLDPNYPYEGGGISSWGFNILTGDLFDPRDHTDFMGYCQPSWISDYNYQAMYDRIVHANGTASIATLAPRSWRVILKDTTGVRWGRTIVTRSPVGGEAREASMFDDQGRLLGKTSAYATRLSELDGWHVMLPLPPPNTAWLHIEGIGRVQR